jgi:hypothetical protein
MFDGQSTIGKLPVARSRIRGWLRLGAVVTGAAICAGAPLPLAASQSGVQVVTDGPLPGHIAAKIDLEIADTTVSAVIDVLRATYCAAVSFIPAPRDQRLRVALHGASVERVLRELAARNPAYRYERIAGRDVLYPVAPEFQTVLQGVRVKDRRRF